MLYLQICSLVENDTTGSNQIMQWRVCGGGGGVQKKPLYAYILNGWPLIKIPNTAEFLCLLGYTKTPRTINRQIWTNPALHRLEFVKAIPALTGCIITHNTCIPEVFPHHSNWHLAGKPQLIQLVWNSKPQPRDRIDNGSPQEIDSYFYWEIASLDFVWRFRK
jgi:hypothetical protein